MTTIGLLKVIEPAGFNTVEPEVKKLKKQGFTLVELLVVMLIIGILLGITLLSPVTGNIHKSVEKEATRLEVLFSQIRDKALLDNAEYGFSVDDSGYYRWWLLPYESKKWVVINEKPFQPYKILNGIVATIEIPDDMHSDHGREQEGPTVVFYSDYQTTPFSLYLVPNENKKQSVVLQTDGFSDVEITR